MARLNISHFRLAVAVMTALIGVGGGSMAISGSSQEKSSSQVALPPPNLQGGLALEQALQRRRSQREFTSSPLSLSQISNLLWAAQGLSNSEGLRTAPSAGGLYPLELYLVAGKVEGLKQGLYRYRPEPHALDQLATGDLRAALAQAAWGQDYVKEAAAVLLFTAVVERTAQKYGDRAERYVFLEAGHASQNVYLEATSLKLATVAVGAFEGEKVRQALGLSQKETPIYLMPLGHPR